MTNLDSEYSLYNSAKGKLFHIAYDLGIVAVMWHFGGPISGALFAAFLAVRDFKNLAEYKQKRRISSRPEGI